MATRKEKAKAVFTALTWIPVFEDNFNSPEDVFNNFQVDKDRRDDIKIIYASYTYEDYSGSAIVIFTQDGKLYEVNGGHCSCNGLEGQWSPEETSWPAIAMRNAGYTGRHTALGECIAAHNS